MDNILGSSSSTTHDINYDDFLCWKRSNETNLQDERRKRCADMFHMWNISLGKKCQRVKYVDELVITTDECIMVVDDGCKYSIVNINSFLIESFAGVMISEDVALHSMAVSRLELVNNTFTLLNLPHCEKFILVYISVFFIEIHCKRKTYFNLTKLERLVL